MNIDIQFYYHVCVRLNGELHPLTPEERVTHEMFSARTAVDAAFVETKMQLFDAKMDPEELEHPATAIVWTCEADVRSFRTYHVFWDEKLKQLVAERRTLQEEEQLA